MKAIMLAAGLGLRLERGPGHPPKAILRFGGKTLLERHIDILRRLPIDQLVIVTGYRSEAICDGIARAEAEEFVQTIYNPDFTSGSVLSLWTAREQLLTGEDIVFMDADVLYDERLMRRLLDSEKRNCFLMDRNIEPGDEPVKICIRDDNIVDFRKLPEVEHDYWGEWPGFVKMEARIAEKVVKAAQSYVDAGRVEEMYEETFRDVVLSEPPGTFEFEDITGLPWIEIDFVADLARARQTILPQLQDGGEESAA